MDSYKEHICHCKATVGTFFYDGSPHGLPRKKLHAIGRQCGCLLFSGKWHANKTKANEPLLTSIANLNMAFRISLGCVSQ